ncbi:hypothetical protein RB195_018004 [Necator americanus]
MSLNRLVCYAFLLMAFFSCIVALPVMLGEDLVETPSGLSYLLKRRDVASALPFELPEHLLKSMLKYRRY